MNMTLRATQRILGGTALLSAAALLPGTALASTVGPARVTQVKVAQVKMAQAKMAPARAASARRIRRCKATQTEIWLGLGNGGGTAGTIFYPLEFSNVSRHTCTLRGFPRVTAINRHGHRIGPAARHIRLRHTTITLRPGSTAHARLGIIEAGNVCSRPVRAAGLKVRGPHQGRSTQIGFSFQTCQHRQVLVVRPVRAGVGIP